MFLYSSFIVIMIVCCVPFFKLIVQLHLRHIPYSQTDPLGSPLGGDVGIERLPCMREARHYQSPV